MKFISFITIAIFLFGIPLESQAETSLTYLEHVLTRTAIGANLNSIAYGNNVYIATGKDDDNGKGNIFISNNINDWSTVKSEYQETFNGVKFLNGKFYVFGKWRNIDEFYMPYYSRIWSSSNGSDWTLIYSEIIEGNPQWGVTDLTYGDGVFVFSINDRLFSSANNFSSVSQTTAIKGTGYDDQFGLSKVCFGNNLFVAVNPTQRSWAVNKAYSHNGINWTTIDNEPSAENIAFVNNHFVSLSGAYMRFSNNGINWQNIPQGKGSAIAFANGTYIIPNAIIGHPHTDLRYSTNLHNNISRIFRRHLGFDEWSDLRDVVAGKNGFVIVGGAGIFYSAYNKTDDYPQIIVNDTIDLALGQKFEYCISAMGFSPDMIRISLEHELVLPPGIKFNNTTWGKSIHEECPHFSGTPTQAGQWPMLLYVYEEGLGEQNLYVKKRVLFNVSDKTHKPEFISNNNIFVFPSVVDRSFSVMGLQSVDMLTLFDVMGKKIINFDTDGSHIFDLEWLSNGTYYVQIILKSGEVKMSKIIKI